MKLPATYPECMTGTIHRDALANLVIFGDSYSSTTVYDWEDEGMEPPEDEYIPWPGYIEIHQRSPKVTLHNYAISGATAQHNLARELAQFFEDFPAKDGPKSEPALGPARTTYVLFIGINDVGEQEDLPEIVEQVFDAAHNLYIKAGARNFIFFDVPPIDRAPEAAYFNTKFQQTVRMRVEEWNELLREGVAEFRQSTPQANVAIFSAHAVLTDVLNRPQEYADFDESDVSKEGGRIWDDELHVTSDVNQIFALRLLEKVQ